LRVLDLATMKDYYQILGISKKASSSEVKKAYHTLAHKHHPDKGGDEKKFKEINEAYQVLSDKAKRAQYDRFGRVFDTQRTGQGPGPGFDFSSVWGSGFSGSSPFGAGNMEDILHDIFGFTSQGTQRQSDLRRGADIQIDIQIPLEDTLKKQNRKIKFKTLIPCPRCKGKGAEPGTFIDKCSLCGGSGRVQQIKRTFLGTIARDVICPECHGEGSKPKVPCNVCKGEGRVRAEQDVAISIPAGVDSNQILEFSGKGQAGRRGGAAGNLYVRVSVKPHPLFKRRGDDLYSNIFISFSQAALGDEISVSTLDNKKILLKIPQGTASGKVLRISGKGVPHFSGYGKGDFYVKLVIETPKRLTKKQKELLEKLKQEKL